MFAALVLLAIGWQVAAIQYGFIPRDFLANGWSDDPIRAWLSPIASVFIPRDLLSAVFDLVLLLITGRFVEKALGPVGLGVVALAGTYASAAGRLLLTPGSLVPGAGLDPIFFAMIGCYFMLYGLPRSLPIGVGQARPVRIAMLAGIWFGIQLVFSLVGQNFELSVSYVEPIFALIAGMALARPLLKWQYRRA
ncbi:rhomboid family intramembrane serine protease [Sphingomonas hylomeconis]|uniref:Rhomboid family intramembrane serine protease n=1 Tax=Sphingomonas hylomeconis TaxID=1395958 RepID=A0ABV7SZ35_9SPHN|nr:rhomboid family intramembrane serine protease [Sphingomonas hylomeconis]